MVFFEVGGIIARLYPFLPLHGGREQKYLPADAPIGMHLVVLSPVGLVGCACNPCQIDQHQKQRVALGTTATDNQDKV